MKWYNVLVKGNVAVVNIFGGIGEEITAQSFVEELHRLEAQGVTSLEVHINSPGGYIFEGLTIYNELSRRNVTVYIDGLAASIAGVIAMAGKKIIIAKSAYLMIHNPSTFTWGDRKELAKTQDVLEQLRNTIIDIYAVRTGKAVEDISEMMDNDTWLNADLALENKFVDEIYTPVQPHPAVNRVSDFLTGFGKTPENRRFQFFNHHKENTTMNKVVQIIRNWLGLSATDSLDENQLAERVGGHITAIEQEVRQLKDENQKLLERVQVFEQADAVRHEQEIQDLLNDAESDGRLLPADRAAWVSFFGQDFVQAAKDLSAREPHSILISGVKPPEKKPEENQSQLSRVTDAIRKQMQG